MTAAPARAAVGEDGYMPMPPLTVDEYRAAVGTELGRSGWVEVGQDMIDAFAQLTGDDQFIHVDPERARRTPFGGTVAHGFLTLSLIGGLGPKHIPPVAGAGAALNYGFDRARLVAPVPSGARVRARFTAAGVDVRASGHVTTRIGVTVDVEGSDKPALVAEWLVVYLVDPA